MPTGALVTPLSAIKTLLHHRSRQDAYTVTQEHPAAGAQQPRATVKPKRKKVDWKRIPLRQALRLAHRFMILCAALAYIIISFMASSGAVSLLNEEIGAFTSEGTYTSDALKRHIGVTTLRESAFVTTLLKNDTRPRNATIYYDMDNMSFDMCDAVALRVRTMYSNAFQQSMYAAIRRGTAHNLTYLSWNVSELIAPLVDCTNFLVTSGDRVMANLNFLVRMKDDVDDVYIMSVTFVNQVYKIYERKRVGPAAVGTLSFINDLRATRVHTHYIVSLGYPFEPLNFGLYELAGWSDRGSWALQYVPTDEPGDLPKIVRTGTRSGFYMKSENERLNIFTEHWKVSETDPIAAATGPEWFTKFAVFDSWAWVHLVQLAFGLQHLASLLVLMTVSYRNFLAGKLWIGDAFVAVSSSLHFRAVIVLLSWMINGFWSFREFCAFDANQISEATRMTINESIMFADLLTLYFGMCALLGMLFRERIDPLIALCCFAIGFANRMAILQWFPSLADRVIEFSYAFYEQGSLNPIEDQDVISPMLLWTTHEVESIPAHVIVAILAPIFCTLVLVLVYIAIRKVHRHYYPDPLRVEKASGMTGKSNNQDTHVKEEKSVLTLFEIATGAKLANKYGLLAEYDNCMYIKGMKFATPDGIYSSGFVIVNKKYLVQAEDIWGIVLMKILQLRYTNLYAYQVNGNTVEQVARLVYPSTFTLSELLSLNTNILS